MNEHEPNNKILNSKEIFNKTYTLLKNFFRLLNIRTGMLKQFK